LIPFQLKSSEELNQPQTDECAIGNLLHDDVLVEILSYLPIWDIDFSICYVCKRFFQLSKLSSLYVHKAVSLVYPPDQQLLNQVIKDYFKNSPQFKKMYC